MSKVRYPFPGAVLMVSAAASCTAAEPAKAPENALPGLALPAALKGKAELLSPASADYSRADRGTAVKSPGKGGIRDGIVIRMTADVPLFRMWSGPTKKDERGYTNRLGEWWTFDAPHGTQQEYRQRYAICKAWNDLTWVARCTLKKGAIVAIGPGNSTDAATCKDTTGKEAYPANDRDWQVWIKESWTRVGADKELECPAESVYEAEVGDIAKSRAAAPTR